MLEIMLALSSMSAIDLLPVGEPGLNAIAVSVSRGSIAARFMNAETSRAHYDFRRPATSGNRSKQIRGRAGGGDRGQMRQFAFCAEQAVRIAAHDFCSRRERSEQILRRCWPARRRHLAARRPQVQRRNDACIVTALRELERAFARLQIFRGERQQLLALRSGRPKRWMIARQLKAARH